MWYRSIFLSYDASIDFISIETSLVYESAFISLLSWTKLNPTLWTLLDPEKQALRIKVAE